MLIKKVLNLKTALKTESLVGHYVRVFFRRYIEGSKTFVREQIWQYAQFYARKQECLESKTIFKDSLWPICHVACERWSKTENFQIFSRIWRWAWPTIGKLRLFNADFLSVQRCCNYMICYHIMIGHVHCQLKEIWKRNFHLSGLWKFWILGLCT